MLRVDFPRATDGSGDVAPARGTERPLSADPRQFRPAARRKWALRPYVVRSYSVIPSTVFGVKVAATHAEMSDAALSAPPLRPMMPPPATK
mgnify:CR=1 FL=1